ncbi:hypothetical protein PPTG_09571 [Phytophthora nicotianae INRA-310]|uniref:RxLR effector protein n=2 Tax=Phytophthora nicotianae TaxID=4792 RepID=W2QI09_PHYN3|nr:hypothetical protein PPTG_09571 [Phytophthora nicotianae INRA-310]ETN11905.1 hypothetical protein PPTG_09571 [Phytophthora nicotianae INRA-310]
MDKHVLSVVVALLLLVATFAREASNSSSTDTAGSSIVDVSSSHAIVNTGGTAHRMTVNPQDPTSESSLSSHKATVGDGELRYLDTDHPQVPSASNFESVTGSTTSSSPPLSYASSDADRSPTTSPESIYDFHSNDAGIHDHGAGTAGGTSNEETGIVGDPESFLSLRSYSESAASSLYNELLTTSLSEDERESAATITIIDSAPSYSAGTVTPAIQSAALELSTSSDELQNTPSPSTSSKTATSTIDQATNSNQADDNDGISSNFTTTSNDSPVVYASVVLGVVGLIGAVIQAKRKHLGSDKWRATTEVVTPHMPRGTAWVHSDDTQVRVIIDKNNIALL